MKRHNSDSLVKVVNKEEKDNSSKKSNSLKEEIDERLKSIERSMTYTQDNGLVGKPRPKWPISINFWNI